MDTKLKKSHKLTYLIITLIILIPAVVLVTLYPRMESAMLDKKNAYEQMNTESAPEMRETVQSDRTVWEVDSAFVNYAVEASYYLYGQMFQEYTKVRAAYSVMNEFGWINDYYYMIENSRYYTDYQPEEQEENGGNYYYRTGDGDEELRFLLNGEENSEDVKEQLSKQGAGYLIMQWDQFGALSDIRFVGSDNYIIYDRLYERAQASYEQYKNNVHNYNVNSNAGDENRIDADQLVPKNFRAVFVIDSDSDFVYEYDEHYVGSSYYYYSPDAEQLYLETGAYLVVLIGAFFVLIMALILPFFKKLETGWEKLFCMPFEVICCLIGLGVCAACGMYMLMCNSTFSAVTEWITDYGEILFLGYSMSAETVYGLLIAGNLLGWSACFLLEYICVASLRQFFCGPKAYLRDRLLLVIFLRWCIRQCRKLYRYVTDIDITEKLNKSIVKIVAVNFIILTVLCCMWFMGIAGVIIYSVILYVLLRKYGENLQRQYRSILNATGQMSEGNLKITLEDDLGVFEPLGKELMEVQQGFAKAVAEEAKSQNMKTELITNVSHDLKTPLTAIITYVDLLKKEDITEEERASYIATLEQKSQRLKVLIEDLFEVSKANSGNVQMNFMDVDVVNLMKQVRLEMEEQLMNSDLTFRWNLPEEKVILSLDGDRMYRVFENLLNNVLKYAMPYSRVYVDILPTTSEVRIIFRNMSASELDFDPQRLTERFVRGDKSRNSEGSGLGLAIAKSFVELQNGEFSISVDGDLFKVTLTFARTEKEN